MRDVSSRAASTLVLSVPADNGRNIRELAYFFGRRRRTGGLRESVEHESNPVP